MDEPREILIVGRPDDPQVTGVHAELAALGVPTRLWDSAAWPGRQSVVLHGAPFALSGPDGPTDRVAGVYVRDLDLDPRRDRFAEDLDQRPLSLLAQLAEYRGLLTSALLLLEARGVRMANPVSGPPVHALKPWQLARFTEQGLPVPPSLVTNDPAAVRDFAAAHAEVVFKPVSGGALVRTLSPQMLQDDALARLSSSPVLFQRRMRGDNVRVFVCDERVIGAGRIVSDALDYRSGPHDVAPLTPSAELAQAAVTAARAVGLRFSGVDAIVADDGHFSLLEANPSPMFARFDQLAGTAVAGGLARWLAEACR